MFPIAHFDKVYKQILEYKNLPNYRGGSHHLGHNLQECTQIQVSEKQPKPRGRIIGSASQTWQAWVHKGPQWPLFINNTRTKTINANVPIAHALGIEAQGDHNGACLGS